MTLDTLSLPANGGNADTVDGKDASDFVEVSKVLTTKEQIEANTDGSNVAGATAVKDIIVELKGDFPIRTDGFTLSRPEHDDNWDYSTYTTVYREIDGGAQFSNDGSVYTEVEFDELE